MVVKKTRKWVGRGLRAMSNWRITRIENGIKREEKLTKEYKDEVALAKRNEHYDQRKPTEQDRYGDFEGMLENDARFHEQRAGRYDRKLIRVRRRHTRGWIGWILSLLEK